MAHHPEPVVENIIALAKQGLPRSEIARQVGMTRSAVLGLLFRRGISAPKVTKPARPKRTSAARTITRKHDSKGKADAIAAAAVKAAAIEAQAKAVSSTAGISWDDLNSPWQCRWPIADGLWCGEAKTIGSYCAHHYGIAHRAA